MFHPNLRVLHSATSPFPQSEENELSVHASSCTNKQELRSGVGDHFPDTLTQGLFPKEFTA